MTSEESMSSSFRLLLVIQAYRDLSDNEEAFFELYPEYVVKKRIVEKIGERAEERGLAVDVEETGNKIDEIYVTLPSAEDLEMELKESRKKRSIINKGVEKVLEKSALWVTDYLDKKEFSLKDLEDMHGKAPEKYRPIITESINHLKIEDAGSTTPNIDRIIS
jgi:hypothetical protein